ncbi:keratin, type I cytoskeletal 10-like [Panicum hallii]|uniref:keratin, type I cytoskeletal 10-like n=1 Tax=Panicum hallii TaxID=206008 RepID=UPI000DF4CD15|nr:keratin, type I cytoskeletal 10-like [Panicum hallii]
MNDHSIANWLHTTVSKSVFNTIYEPRTSAFTIWNDIEGLFRDNELQRMVYLEANFHTLQQAEQVLNLLRNLNPKYRHLKPVITSKFPPHTFQSTRSYLLLEELCDKRDAKAKSGQAYHTTHGGSSTATSWNSDNCSGSGGSGNKQSGKRTYRGSSSGPNFGGGGFGSRGGQGGNNNSGGGRGSSNAHGDAPM